MAANGYTSPFPTSHDTIGASTLNAHAYMPSSPPSSVNRQQSEGGISSKKTVHETSLNAVRRGKSRLTRLSELPRDGNESDSEANLSDYTFDLNKLSDNESELGQDERPGAQSAIQGKSTAPIGETGGPRDFTQNMVELVGAVTMQESNKRTVEENKDHLEENSEIEPPIDMSTPAHVLSRRPVMISDETELEAEHSQVDGSVATPEQAVAIESTEGRLRKELERLRRQLVSKDELIKANKKRVLEGASAAQQLRHLQSELETYKALVKEKDARISEYSHQRVELQQVRDQLEEKRKLLETKVDASALQSMKQEVEKLRAEIAANKGKGGMDTEVVALQSEIADKNSALQELSVRFSELKIAKDSEMKEKSAEIDELKAKETDHYFEKDRLDSELEVAIRNSEIFEERNAALFKRIQHFETQMASLESELSNANSQTENQYNAVKSWATDWSVNVKKDDFYDILDSLKAAYRQREATFSAITDDECVEKANVLEKELRELRLQSTNFATSNRSHTVQLETLQQEAADSRTNAQILREENARLLSKLDSLIAEQNSTQERLATVTIERDQALANADRLREQNSPGSSSSRCHIDHETQDKNHQAELESLQSAHSTAISTLRDTHAETTRTLQELLSAAQARETTLESDLRSLRTMSSDQEARLASLTAEKDDLESRLEAKDAAATAVNEKFAKLLRKREVQWDARIERLLKDRERMGKVLMWSWGENEFPEGSKHEEHGSAKGKGRKALPKQEYKYKFADKEEWEMI